MGVKEQAVKIAPGHYVLDRGIPVAVDVFLSDELFAASEEEAWAQMVTAARLPGVRRVAVTPDTHMGYGVPIGIVIETEGTILPTAAGYDIGCGMVQLRSDLTADAVADRAKRRQWMDAIEERVPLGAGASRTRKQRRLTDDDFQNAIRHGAAALGRGGSKTERDFIPVETEEAIPSKAIGKASQLGSLGGGNHFVEMQVEEGTGRVWVMIHTGSRGFGYQIADHFFRAGAVALGLGPGQKDLIWFDRDSDLGRAYWALHNMAANFAICNRLLIGEAVREALEEVFGGEAEIFYEISHNLIQEEGGKGVFVHRKGATRAFPPGHLSLAGTAWQESGHPILIPGSMATGSAILYADAGASASVFSVNHGAGRRMGRQHAKRTLDQAEIDRQMDAADILTNTRSTPIDESGPCYKDLDEVLRTIELAGLAHVAHRLRPVACVKGAA